MNGKILAITTIFAIAGCGGSDNNTSGNAPPGNNALEDTVSGTIMAPDGSTPIANATVFIPGPVATRSTRSTNENWTLPCEAPAGNYLAAACTDSHGKFSLNISQLNRVTFPLSIKKGSFSHSINVDLAGAANINIREILLTTSNVKFAVVTGTFDRMEDILAKLGMGTLSSEFKLDLGTENFDLYDGASDLDSIYPEFIKLFDLDNTTGKAFIYAYDMVFINWRFQ